LAVEGRAVNVQQLSGLSQIAVALFQGVLDLLSTHTTGRRWRRASWRLAPQQFGRQEVSGNKPVRSTHRCSDHHIAQLPYVPRPGIAPEELQDSRRNAYGREAFFIEQKPGK